MEYGVFDKPHDLVYALNKAVNKTFASMKTFIGKEHKTEMLIIPSVEELSDPDIHIIFGYKNGFVIAQVVCKCPKVHFVCFSEKMRELLGAKKRVMYFSRTYFTFPFPVGLNRAAPDKLFVYSDLTEPHIVGDSVAPLLRVVPLENAPYGSNIVKTFLNPHYYPLLKNSFRTVEIDIRDSLGKLVPFENGTLICVLHFKKSYH